MSTSVAQTTAISNEAIIDLVVELIHERELKIGDQLPSIRELAKIFHCKATAVRDSLVQAQALGLVKVLPRAGAFVQQTSLNGVETSLPLLTDELANVAEHDNHNIFHLLDARRMIELELGLRAVRRRQLEDLFPLRQTLEAMKEIPLLERRSNYVELDIQLHLQLAKLGGNDVLTSMLDVILKRLRPYLERLPWNEERRQYTDRLHTQLYQALVDGDEETFRSQMVEHQSSAYDCLLSEVQTPLSAATNNTNSKHDEMEN